MGGKIPNSLNNPRMMVSTGQPQRIHWCKCKKQKEKYQFKKKKKLYGLTKWAYINVPKKIMNDIYLQWRENFHLEMLLLQKQND